MKILITGALGHIGSFILKKSKDIKKIKEFYLVDNLSTNRYCSLFNIKNNKKFFFFNIDLSKKNSLKNFKKVDYVIHLASITDAEASIKNKNNIFKKNLSSFNEILNYCKKNDTKLIHISSTSVYGEQKKEVDENCYDLRPKSPYAIVKLKEEQKLQKIKNQIDFITLRFGTIAGVSPGMRFHTAVNKFCFNAVNNIPIPIWKSMENKFRPYLSLQDAFDTIKFILAKNLFDKEIYNVVSENLKAMTIIKEIKKNVKNIKIIKVNSKLINQYSYKVSSKKFELKFFKFKRVIKNEIQDTIKIFNGLGNVL